jgi:hypothetical protein
MLQRASRLAAASWRAALTAPLHQSSSLCCAVQPVPHSIPHSAATSVRYISSIAVRHAISTGSAAFARGPLPSPARTPRSSSPPSMKRERTTDMTHFSPKARTSSTDPLGGELAPTAPGTDSGSLTLSSASRRALLNPLRVTRGHSAKAAAMDRQLHAPNKNRLNHSLAYHIDRQKTWVELVNLLFEHMHHMTPHNWSAAFSISKRLPDLHSMLTLSIFSLSAHFDSFFPFSSGFAAPSVSSSFPLPVRCWT